MCSERRRESETEPHRWRNGNLKKGRFVNDETSGAPSTILAPLTDVLASLTFSQKRCTAFQESSAQSFAMPE